MESRPAPVLRTRSDRLAVVRDCDQRIPPVPRQTRRRIGPFHTNARSGTCVTRQLKRTYVRCSPPNTRLRRQLPPLGENSRGRDGANTPFCSSHRLASSTPLRGRPDRSGTPARGAQLCWIVHRIGRIAGGSFRFANWRGACPMPHIGTRASRSRSDITRIRTGHGRPGKHWRRRPRMRRRNLAVHEHRARAHARRSRRSRSTHTSRAAGGIGCARRGWANRIQFIPSRTTRRSTHTVPD